MIQGVLWELIKTMCLGNRVNIIGLRAAGKEGYALIVLLGNSG